MKTNLIRAHKKNRKKLLSLLKKFTNRKFKHKKSNKNYSPKNKEILIKTFNNKNQPRKLNKKVSIINNLNIANNNNQDLNPNNKALWNRTNNNKMKMSKILMIIYQNQKSKLKDMIE